MSAVRHQYRNKDIQIYSWFEATPEGTNGTVMTDDFNTAVSYAKVKESISL